MRSTFGASAACVLFTTGAYDTVCTTTGSITLDAIMLTQG
jgi:hypothetical protein